MGANEYNEAEMSNALVGQKDTIISMINRGMRREALELINFTEKVWTAAGYGYKTRELRERVHNSGK